MNQVAPLVLSITVEGRPPDTISHEKLIACGERILEKNHLSGRYLVEVNFAPPGLCRRLNRVYRGKSGIAEVLSFPIYEKFPTMKDGSQIRGTDPGFLGSVVIRRRAISDKDSTREIIALFEHGLNHLIGKHHR